jgi:hypothetical protein
MRKNIKESFHSVREYLLGSSLKKWLNSGKIFPVIEEISAG